MKSLQYLWCFIITGHLSSRIISIEDDTQYGQTSWTQKPDGALIVVPSSLLFGRLLEWVVWSAGLHGKKSCWKLPYMAGWNYLEPFLFFFFLSKTFWCWWIPKEVKVVIKLLTYYTISRNWCQWLPLFTHTRWWACLLSPPVRSWVKQKCCEMCGPYQ